MFPVCWAFAYAIESSLATFSAAARLIGAATFALMSDIAARSGSSSPARAFSSSRVRLLYSCSPTRSSLGALRDVTGLLRVRVRDRVVAQHVERDRGVDRSRDVRVDEGHRRALRQLLARERVQLLARQLLVLLLLAHAVPPSLRQVDCVMLTFCSAFA